MAQRGRRSEADRTVKPIGKAPGPEAPETLEPEAQALWKAIVDTRKPDYFSAADLPLLRKYVHTIETLVPNMNRLVAKEFDQRTLAERDKLVRLAASLAGKLRLCVSSRTRPDSAGISRSEVRTPPWVRD